MALTRTRCPQAPACVDEERPERGARRWTSGPGAASAPWLEDLWDRHSVAVYTLAFALLGDEASAGRAVQLGLGDLASSHPRVANHDALRSWAGHVYRHSQDLVDEVDSTRPAPSAMDSLRQLAHQQRAALALCLFGGHTSRDVASLLGLAPKAVADLLRNGLREAERLTAGGSLGHA